MADLLLLLLLKVFMLVLAMTETMLEELEEDKRLLGKFPGVASKTWLGGTYIKLKFVKDLFAGEFPLKDLLLR